ncbi:MAG: [Eubacterium sp.]|nr:[FeFe] hydrogenase H-cluster maturation GTPase HydF [Eubacterium sp.]
MGLNDTPRAERLHIGFFGVRNAGKSSLVNRITNQQVSLVSEIKGTTTDAVRKSMELLPLGPVVIIDTAGIDDEGELGEKRVEATREVLKSCDIAILVTENDKLNQAEIALLKVIKGKNIPYLIVHNKADLKQTASDGKIYVSAKTGEGIEALKETVAKLLGDKVKEIHFVADFIREGDTVVLVCPIDESAPKGRLILPQQLAIRDILDKGGIATVVQPEQLTATLNALQQPPALVITDSQAFGKVMKLVPNTVPLTSFSILMARYKGFLYTALQGAETLDALPDGAKVLISEGCTHHRQCNDIGTVKLPGWLKAYTGKQLEFAFTSGHGFPDDLTAYDLVIHCGGCMLNDAEMKNRRLTAEQQQVPFTNYGTVIAKMNGILERSAEIVKSEV